MGFRLFGLLITSFAVFPWSCLAQNIGSYDVFPTAVTGGARYVGLGGAVVAYPDDYYATYVNPAGLGGLAGSGIDFGSDSSNVDNFVVDLNNPRARALNDPINFSFYGFRFVSEDGWGFGLTQGTPFSLDNAFTGTVRRIGTQLVQTGQDQTEVKATNDIYTAAVGKAFCDKKLSLGVGINYIQVAESYNFTPVLPTTASVQQTVTNDTFSADIGALARPWSWLQFGAVYKMGFKVPFDPSRNFRLPFSTTQAINPYRNAKSPDRFNFGLAWKPHKMFSLFAQGDWILKLRDGVVVSAGAFPGFGNVVATGRYNTLSGHWGAEFVPIDEPDLTFRLWAGGYLETTGIEGGFSRYHRTAGFGCNPWFLTLNMAIDDANLYDNFTVGLGVDMLQVAGRVAKYYGWQLPI